MIKDPMLSPKHYYEDVSALDGSNQINGNIGDIDALNKFFFTRINKGDRKVKN